MLIPLLLGCVAGLDGAVWQVWDPLPGQVADDCDAVFAVGPLSPDGAASVAWLDECGGMKHPPRTLHLEGETSEGITYLVGSQDLGQSIGCPWRWQLVDGAELRIWDAEVDDLVPFDRFDGAGGITVELARLE